MNVYYEFIAYGGSFFKDDKGELLLYKNIADNFYKLGGRKGKLIYQGYTSVYEQGYSGGYDSYGFVYQDDLSSVSLDTNNKVFLEYCE
jgi:hypothetical protein